MSCCIRFLRLFASDDVLIRMLCRVQRPDFAWQLASLQSAERLCDDPTYTYTISFAEQEKRKAELAIEAGAYEWAWINAADALAVLEWKGALDDDIAISANGILTASEQHIPNNRRADLREKHTRYKQQHNSDEERAFKTKTTKRHMWIWRHVLRSRMPRITDRPD